MSRMTRLLVVVLSGVVLGNVVFAQENGPEKKLFGGSVEAWGTATDNRDSSPDGMEEDNIDVGIRVRGDVKLETEAVLLDLYYAPSYRWRSDPSDIQNENEWHHDVSLMGKLKVTESTELRARERFNYTDDPDITEGGVNLRRDASYIMNRASAGINSFLTETFNVDLVAQHMIKDYDDGAIADNYNEEIGSAELSARKKMSESLVGVAMLGAEMVSYEKFNGIERGYDSYFGGLGLEHKLTPTVTLNGLGGIQAAEYDDDTIDSEVSPLVRLGLKANLAESVALLVNGTYKLDNAYSYPYTSQRHTSVFANLMWAATEALGLSAFAEYRLEEYEADTVNPGLNAASGDETTVLAVLSASYKILSQTTVTASYLFEDVDSDVSMTFTRNAGTLALKQEF